MTTQRLFLMAMAAFLPVFLYAVPALASDVVKESVVEVVDQADSTINKKDDGVVEEKSVASPNKESSVFSILDMPHRYVSSGVAGLAKSVDEFFSDEKVLYDTNASIVRFTYDTVFNEAGDVGYVGDTSVKISLPNMQKKLKLVFENDVKDGRDNVDRSLESSLVDATQQQSYFAGLEMIWGEFENWKLRPGLGLRLSASSEYFLRLRASRKYAISEFWSGYLSNTAYWYSVTGNRYDISMELNRRINDDFLFRSVTFSRWEEVNNYWNLSQVLSLTQSLSDKRALIYQIGAFGQSQPVINASNYLVQLRYRKRIHSNYLFMELIPKAVYLQENNFRADSSFTIRLEIVFKG